MTNDPLLMEPAAFLDMWQEKYFLGQEFLTWLWLSSEINGNLMLISPYRAPGAAGQAMLPAEIEIWFEGRLTLESGEGGDKKSVTCQDPGAQWAEAHTALKRGKKLTRARLKIRSEEKEWGLSLAADTLVPQAVKFPQTFAAGEEEEDSEAGRLLERVALLEELMGIVNAFFRRFLELRLSPDWEMTELPKLNGWLREQA